MVNANNIVCRFIVYTGTGSSCALEALIKIEMLLHTTSKNIEMQSLTISDKKGLFQLNINTDKVGKDVILTEPIPDYRTLVQFYRHLRGVILIMIPKQNYQSTLILEQATFQR